MRSVAAFQAAEAALAIVVAVVAELALHRTVHEAAGAR